MADVKTVQTPTETITTAAPVMIADASALLVVRQVLMTIGGILTGKGYISSSDAETYIGLIMLIVPIAWQWYLRYKAK